MTHTAISRLFKTTRAKKGLVIFDQSMALAIGPAEISAYETGRKKPPPEYWKQACDWLGLHQREFLAAYLQDITNDRLPYRWKGKSNDETRQN